jgi:Bacteriophage probable baseplate hub protein
MAKPEPKRPLVPTFAIMVNGTALPLPATAHVASLSIAQDLDMPAMFAFQLTGSDDQKQNVPWVDDTLFSIGNAVEIKLGYGDKVDSVMKGEIVGIEPSYHVSRLPDLQVRGFDRLHRLARGRKSKTFADQKDSDIASQIASGAGLTSDAEDSAVTLKHVYQHNQTDLDFLIQRARRIGFEVSVDDTTLKFKKRANGESAVMTLSQGDGLLEFRARLSSAGQVTDVFVRGWSVQDKKEVVGHASASDAASMGGQQTGPDAVQSSFGTVERLIASEPIETQPEADQVAKAKLEELALGYITGEGRCQGRTDMRTGQVIELKDIGTRFSGSYYVTGVEHRYTKRNGYVTHFRARRNSS